MRLVPLRLLDRYLIRETLPPFVLALLVFTFLLIAPFIIELAEKLITMGVDGGTIVRLMVRLLPQALALTIPMALLLAILIALGRLSADREWVALQACGVGLTRLLWPIGLLAVLCWGATSYVLIVLKPAANQSYRELEYEIVASRAEKDVKPRAFFEDFPHVALYVRDVRQDKPWPWRDVLFADTRSQSQPVLYLARRGELVAERSTRTIQVVLAEVNAYTANPDAPDQYRVDWHDQVKLSLDPETVFPRKGPPKDIAEMTVAELKARIEENRRLTPPVGVHNEIMEIQKKFSIPFACLLFGAIGLGLGVSSRREGKLASFVIGIAVIFVYYVFMWTGMSAAKGAWLSPHVAPWLPNIILTPVAVALLWGKGRSADGGFQLSVPGAARIQRLLERPALGWVRRFVGLEMPSPGAAPVPRGGAGQSRPVLVIRIPHWSLPRPRIIDRYVSTLYGRFFALAFVAFLGIFYISTFIDLSDKLFKGQTTGGQLASYLWYMTPQYVYYLIPLSALVSSLVVIGLLTKNSELVVMKACGMSLYRVAAPLTLFGGLAGLVLFGLEERVVAHANDRAERIRHVIRGGLPQTFDLLNRKWMVGTDGSIYHYLFFDPREKRLNSLSVFRLEPGAWRLAGHVYVATAEFVRGRTPDRATWRGRKGWFRAFGRDSRALSSDGPLPDAVGFGLIGEQDLELEPPSYFTTELPDADRMTYSELKRYIEQLRASGFHVVPDLVKLHRKLSFPLVALIMTVLAVPFAVTTGKRGALYGVGVGIVLALLYWTTASVFAALGSAGVMPPALAAWAPNILFGAVAAYALLTVRT